MKKVVTALAAVVAVLATSAAIAETAGIDVTSTGFRPNDVTVEAGSSVSWKNTDTVAHGIVVDKTACNLALQPQQSSSCAFATPGTFTYSDPASKDPAFSGTVTVTPAVQRSVTLSANRNIAIFGDSVTLAGATSTKKAGETVTVISRPAGEPEARIAVTTAANGAWSLRVQPRINTEYQVQYGDVMSGKLAVDVRPRITFQKVGVNKFLIVVLSNKTLAGQTVQVTRYVKGTGWVPVGDTQLATIARTDSIAVRTVIEPFPQGTKLRAVMSDDQTGPNYIDAHSNFIVK
jgi:plastocyanin